MNGMTSVTTVQLRFKDDKSFDKALMLRLLRIVYPVSRIKEKNKFKRGVIVDGRSYIIPKDNLPLFGDMFSVLKTLYACSDDEITHVLNAFYKFNK